MARAMGRPLPSDHDGERDAHGCVPGCPVRLLDEQAGPRTSGARRSDLPRKDGTLQMGFTRNPGCAASTGSASRFYPVFYPDAPDEGEGPRMAGQGPLRAEVRWGDCRDVLATLPDACCDALVTDPPAGVSFMGKDWDGHKGGRDQWIAWLAGIMAEARRVIKPGGYALVWALPRTSHWTAMALEDAGWSIRDSVAHLFGSGFPKSHSCLKPAHEVWWLAKAPGPLQPLQIDAARVPTGESLNGGAYAPDKHKQGGIYGKLDYACGDYQQPPGRWPPNTLFSHVGGPDGCQPARVRRVPADKRGQGRPRGTFPHSDDAWGNGHRAYTGAETAGDGTEAQQAYRCHPQCPIRVLDEQAGPRTSSPGSTRGASRHIYGNGAGFTAATGESVGYHDTNPAVSRFFPTFGLDPQDAAPFRYQPKASRAERNAGCDGLAGTRPDAHNLSSNACATCGRRVKANGSGEKCECGPARVTIKLPPAANGHPTVKPLALMQWLCKLVTPEGGVVLDPFCGSGSTLLACVKEGFGFIGIEAEPAYVDIARARIAHEQEQRAGPLFAGIGTATKAAREA